MGSCLKQIEAHKQVNREFAKRIPERYRYVNREQDLGRPGIRKAKTSYRPSHMVEKWFGRLEPVKN